METFNKIEFYKNSKQMTYQEAITLKGIVYLILNLYDYKGYTGRSKIYKDWKFIKNLNTK